jgi:hypothetical protein
MQHLGPLQTASHVHACFQLGCACHASLLLLLHTDHCVACRAQIPAWSSCGNSSRYNGVLAAPDPSMCCPLETTCRKYNDFFWQCMPDDYKPEPEVITTYAGSCTGTKVRSCLPTNCQLVI